MLIVLCLYIVLGLFVFGGLGFLSCGVGAFGVQWVGVSELLF